MTTRTERLIDDMKNVATHAEELLETTSGQLSDKARAARLRLNGALESARKSCEGLQHRAVEGLKSTEETIRANPLKTVGIVLGVGFLLGLLIKRRH